jgi:DNA-binding LacI/PurR family transcriptional regulator
MKTKKTKLKDIAKAAGLDVSTVSLCLNNSPKVSETTKLKVKEIAEKMNYSPNLTAQALRGGKSHTIGIGLSSLADPFFNIMLNSMVSCFYRKNYFSLVTVIRNTDAKEIFNNMFQRNVDGLCMGNAIFKKEIIGLCKEFINSGKPLSMFIEKDMLPKMDGVEANYAICDLTDGVKKILQHLYDLNHRRIAIAGYIPIRYNAYCSFMEEKNIEVDERLELNNWGSWADDLSLEDNLLRIMQMAEPPTALFATTDQIALRIMKILLKNGIRIPQDISIVGINDTPPMDIVKVPMTTLRIPVNDIGISMAQMLLEQINNPGSKPKQDYVETELIIRESTVAI